MSDNSQQSSTLFRPEVFEARRDTWLGEIMLVRPVSFTLLAAVACFLAFAVIAFLVWGEYTRKAKASGYIVPGQGLIKIVAQQTGIIAELRVREGQTVEQGDVLAVLNSERAIAGGGSLAEVGKQLEVRRASLNQDRGKIDTLYGQQARALGDRMTHLRAELAQLERSIELQRDRLRITERMLETQRRLYADKFISELALQQKEQERLADLGALEALKRNRTALQRDLGMLEADLRSLPVKRENEISVLERNLATLEQDRIENETRREIYLTAPHSGAVTAIQADPGKLATAGQTLLSMIPSGSELQAEVYVPSRAAGFIRTGTQALMQYQAFPYQKFGSHGGKVIKISRTAVASNELPFPAQQGELYYIATLELAKQTVTAYGNEVRLQSGMMLDASILLDRRTLIEWVFEPLYSISGRWGA
jgi:membrane fusion protein